MAKRTLKDTAKDPNAKEAFIQETNTKKVIPSEAGTKMMNTRLSEELIHRIKIFCAINKLTIQEFITEAASEKLKQDRGK